MAREAKQTAEELLSSLNPAERERVITFMYGLISKRKRPSPVVDASKCENELRALWDRFLTVRSVFSYFRASDVGKSSRRSAPYYQAQGKDLTVHFPTPLTDQDIDPYNGVAYWINQAYVASAYAILDRHQVVGNEVVLNPSLPGFKAVDLLRRVRMRVTHSNGGFDPEDKDHKKLNQELINHFQPRQPDPHKFQLHIDEVLDPMLEEIIEYVKAKARL